MRNDAEQINILFHNRAGEVMRVLFVEFRHSITALDRQGDENVFQQQQGKYCALLKHRLDRIALELMDKLNTGADRYGWNRTVSGFIQDYMTEFGRKLRAL